MSQSSSWSRHFSFLPDPNCSYLKIPRSLFLRILSQPPPSSVPPPQKKEIKEKNILKKIPLVFFILRVFSNFQITFQERLQVKHPASTQELNLTSLAISPQGKRYIFYLQINQGIERLKATCPYQSINWQQSQKENLEVFTLSFLM